MFIDRSNLNTSCKSSSQDDVRRLTEECIENVKSHDFASAIAKLNFIDDNYKINYIVKEIYNNQAANIDLLLQFANNISNKTRSFLVYKALDYEIRTNKDADAINLIELRTSLRNYLFNVKNISRKVKKDAEKLNSQLMNDLESASIETLKVAMLEGGYRWNKIISQISDEIFTFNHNMFSIVIDEVVKETYGKISNYKLLSNINRHFNISQKILGYKAMYDAMKNHRDLNNYTVLTLAFRIKETMKDSNYSLVNPNLKVVFEKLKSILPQSVRNAVFAKKVCIKSIRFNEYFYADTDLKYRNERYPVFTWIPDDILNKTEVYWRMEAYDDQFSVKNIAHDNYLHASDGVNHDSEERRVHTWNPADAEDEEGQEDWQIEPYGNNCYIKNVIVDEYLYPAFQFDNVRRRIFMRSLDKCDTRCLWKIEDCEG